MPPRWRGRYFTAIGHDAVQVRDDVRRAVVVAHHNLATEAAPPGRGRFDLVVCRNVLIYFDLATTEVITRRLAAACRDRDDVVVGAVERWLQSDRLAPPRPVEARRPEPGRGSSPERGAVRRREAPRDPSPVPVTPRPLGDAAPDAGLDPAAHLRRGIAAKRAGELGSAVEHLRRARFLAADRWLAPYLLAVCLESLGRSGEAVEAYRHAASLMAQGAAAGLPEADADADVFSETVSSACHARLAALRPPARASEAR
jgi:hypothetical protein